MTEGLRAVSLFAGCGGLDLGAVRAGLDVIWATDIMPAAADAYAQLFPDAEFDLANVRDVRAFPKAEVVLGGYPCQPFSLGGARRPADDMRARLFREFARCVAVVSPLYFVAENVSGLCSLGARRWLDEQVSLFAELGRYGYRVTAATLQAADYGLPQRRRRLFIVGVRGDLGLDYSFPPPTHYRDPKPGQKQWGSHGDAIAGLPIWPRGEFYELDDGEGRNWPWYYMSRNRKARWDDPSYTVLANARHVTLHPAGPSMRLVWSNLADGSKQRWEFTEEYEHTDGHPERLLLVRPRRLSWRECSVLQGFPPVFEPLGRLAEKYEQVGNAVPPALSEAVIAPLVSGSGLVPVEEKATSEPRQTR
ncbi:MAG TPA: DNA cytosine methyltransferase [Acidimicrobiales bacterium]|nr:DNA cytosine methyltransferase [Acidimicrobiales bacterium]